MQFKSFVFVITLGIPILLATAALRSNTLLGLYLPEQHKWTVDSTRIELSDGRHIAYKAVGDTKVPNAILWFHGIASSRSVPASCCIKSHTLTACTKDHIMLSRSLSS